MDNGDRMEGDQNLEDTFTLRPQDRSRARHWFFTENNPEGNLDVVFGELYAAGQLDYVTWQLEIGESGTEHYQGYINFKKQTLFSTVKKILPTAFLALALDPVAARAYCQKLESRIEGPYEFGIFNAPQDKQRIWKALAEDIKAGKRDFELFQKYPQQVICYFKGISNARNIVLPPRNFKTKTILIYGLPGCGKSRYVLDLFPNAFWKSPDSAWFDGYNGQDCIVLDDFYGTLPVGSLLRLLDRYPLLLQTKGGHSTMQAKYAVITSNSLPTDWYRTAIQKNSWIGRAICRRFDGLIIANSGPSEGWTYLCGPAAQSQLENPTLLRERANLDGLDLSHFTDNNANTPVTDFGY